jgi:hypothetical protein
MKKIFIGTLLLIGLSSQLEAQTEFTEGIKIPKGSSLSIGKKVLWGWTNGPFISVLSENTNDSDVQGLVFYTHRTSTYADPAEESMRLSSWGNLRLRYGTSQSLGRKNTMG